MEQNLNPRFVGYGSSRSVIRELFEYGKEQAARIGAENVFDFSIGNPSVPPPAEVNDTIRRLLDTEDPVTLYGYTTNQGDPQARRMLADSLNRRFHAGVSWENLYVAAGAASALCCCFRGLMTPEYNEYVVIAPFFPEYRVYIEGNGAKMVLVAPDTAAFQIDFAALEQALGPHTRAVVVNSPNNPSGAVYSPETARRLGELLRRKSQEYSHPVYLLSDEPYREIVYGGLKAPWLPDYYENTIVCYSFSKSLSLPGERIGYVAVPASVQDWQQVYACIWGAGRSMGYVNASALFQRVCAACCDLTADLSVYEKNRDILYQALLEYGYSVVRPDGTFYIFPRALEEDDFAFVERAKKYNLLVVPGTGFGAPGHVRISYCVPTERVLRSLPAFKALAEEYRK